MELKYYHWILMGLFVLTLGSRLFFAFQTPNFDYDAYFNLRQVEHIRENGLPLYDDDLSYGGRIYYFPPFFHYTLAFFNVFMPLGLVGKIIPNLMISFLVFIVFLIAKQITKDNNAALFAALFSSFIPVLFSKTINSVSELTLVVPLFFLALYFLTNLQRRRNVYSYLVIIVILSLTHSSTFFLILGLILYLIFSEVEIIKRNRNETELILFSTLIFVWIQTLFYKKAFLMHGISLIWKNMPVEIITNHFSEITIVGTITQIGWLPLFYGLYLTFKYLFKEKNKYIYTYIALALPVVILLWLKWIEPSLGLIFLGVTFSILFSEFYKITIGYIKKTKIPKYRYIFPVSLTITFIITSFLPAVFLAGVEIQQTVTDTEVQAISWLNEQEGEVVLGALEEGFLINFLAEKESVIDDNFLFVNDVEERAKAVERIYTTTSRIEAVELLNKYKVDYIIVSEKVLEDYQIKKLYFRDEDCIRKVYRGSIEIYRNDCQVKTFAI